MIIAIYGPAGVGKTTQAEALARRLDREWISAGDLIRRSRKFEDYISECKMIDEHILVEMIAEAVRKAEEEGFDVVFDGQPGTPEQVGYWKEVGLLDKLERIILLEAPKEELVKRLKRRKREDDNGKNWERKFDYFEEKAGPFLDEMKRQGVPVAEVCGLGSVNDVADRVEGIIIVEQMVADAERIVAQSREEE